MKLNLGQILSHLTRFASEYNLNCISNLPNLTNLTPYSSKRIGLKIDGKKQILEISEAETSDAGEYSCTIGSAAKCSANLVVEEPKVNFVERLTDTSVGEVGKDVQLKVS